ncbi:unnamed protein product, partial [Staurois parvus]
KLYTWPNAVRQRTHFHCSRVQLPLHPTLCIALGDVRLGCSCSAMETHSMKLYMHCCYANLKATQRLEVFSY